MRIERVQERNSEIIPFHDVVLLFTRRQFDMMLSDYAFVYNSSNMLILLGWIYSLCYLPLVHHPPLICI